MASLPSGIRWDQAKPWNSKTPVDDKGKHTPVGCVAATYAQMMRYYKWPDRGVDKVEHKEPRIRRRHKVGFGQTTYDWANMLESFADVKAVTEAQKKTLGALCYHAGVATETVYNAQASGSFAPKIVMVLCNNFCYDKQVTFRRCVNYTQVEWDRTIRAKFAVGCLVVYCDIGIGDDHAFVCDGYNVDGPYHINWGWRGLADGHFNPNFLSPNQLSIGGDFGGGLSTERGTVIDIKPGHNRTSEGVETPLLTTRKLTMHLRADGPKIWMTNANYSVWMSDVPVKNNDGEAEYTYYGFTTFGAVKLGTTDMVYMDEFVKTKILDGFHDLPSESQLGLNIAKYITVGMWDLLPVYQVTLPNSKKIWRPCIMDVREGNNENSRGRYISAIKKVTPNSWTAKENLTHPFTQPEMVEGSAKTTSSGCGKSTILLRPKDTGRRKLFRPLYLKLKPEGGKWCSYSEISPATPDDEAQEITHKAEHCPCAKGKASLRVACQTEGMGKMQYFNLPDATANSSTVTRPVFVIEPASKTAPMEVERGIGKFSLARVKYAGTVALKGKVIYRYILEYGLERVWTDLVPLEVSVGYEQKFTPKLPDLLKKIAILGDTEFKSTMSFFKVLNEGSKVRLPVLESPTIMAICRRDSLPTTKNIEGPDGISFKGVTDLNAVIEGTLLTIATKSERGQALFSLEANGQNILAIRSFRVTSPTKVKIVFGKLNTYKVTLKSDDSKYGSINLKKALNPDAIPEGITTHIEVRPNGQCELTKPMADDEDITETKSFTIMKDMEVVATFVNHTGVGNVVAQQLRLYPNPTRDYVLPEGIPTGVIITIHTPQGQLIYQVEVVSDTLRIKLTQPQEDTYLLQIGGETHRLIIHY